MSQRFGVTGEQSDFDDAQDFFGFLTGKYFRTESIFDAAATGTAGWIFRGQANSDWELYPTAFRTNPPPDWELFTPQPPKDQPIKDYEPMYLGFHLHAEMRAVQLFLEAADSVGIATPIDYSTMTEGYDAINGLMAGEKTIPEEFPSRGYRSAVALAQHHGIPTRLLDWTESALFAAFFAAHSSRSSDFEREKRPRLGVFYVGVHSIRNPKSGIEIVRAPRHLNNFLRSQRGLFTSMGEANEYFIDHGAWPSLERLIGASESRVQIHLATLKGDKAEDLLRILYDHDVTLSRIMPSLDNVAKSFRYVRDLF